jgi:hypothetical protein
MDTVVHCPNCGGIVHAHCRNNPTCDWWTCPRCGSYGDNDGHSVVRQDGERPT